MEGVGKRLVKLIFWPANSPDINLFEAVWNRMKDYIQCHHPKLGGGKQRTPDSIRKMVKKAWDSVSPEDLVRLIESMPARCQAVRDADGGPTRYQGLEASSHMFRSKVKIRLWVSN
ncbi:Bgt-50704 [Blumeria graminis f. sp. tritici]|uniref:Bgt-50704 n=1 Tax=Blumeria graminis f. sp. tritici TaxID=62690 RepID=A0A9X9PR98_BLUGR|nr:Bgt-50704 [Blumeria graminis f. sp. tritici]